MCADEGASVSARGPEPGEPPTAARAGAPGDLPPDAARLLEQLANLWQVDLDDDRGLAVTFSPRRRS